MSNITETFGVLGLSKFGYHAAVSLAALGAEVVVVDQDETLIRKIAPHVSKAVCADAMDRDILDHIGIPNVDVAIVGFRKAFDVTVLIINYLKSKTKVRKIIVQVDTEEKAEAIRLLGIKHVVFPEMDIAERTVKKLVMPDLVEKVSISRETSIIEIPCPADFVGKSLRELNIRQRFNVYVIGIKHFSTEGKETDAIIAPPPDTMFKKGDSMLLLGPSKDILNVAKEVKNGHQE